MVLYDNATLLAFAIKKAGKDNFLQKLQMAELYSIGISALNEELRRSRVASEFVREKFIKNQESFRKVWSLFLALVKYRQENTKGYSKEFWTQIPMTIFTELKKKGKELENLADLVRKKYPTLRLDFCPSISQEKALAGVFVSNTVPKWKSIYNQTRTYVNKHLDGEKKRTWMKTLDEIEKLIGDVEEIDDYIKIQATTFQRKLSATTENRGQVFFDLFKVCSDLGRALK